MYVPAPSMSHGLAISDGLFAGEQVRMLSVDNIQIVSAAHLHLIRFLLEQDLAAQLVKHNGVHCWSVTVLRLYFSVVQKSQKHQRLFGLVTMSRFVSWGAKYGCIYKKEKAGEI